MTSRFFVKILTTVTFTGLVLFIPKTGQTQDVTVPPPAQLKAVAGQDQSIAVGKKIIFDGSKSINPLGTPLGYAWDFGDGLTTSGADVEHIYQQPGDYTVTLTVANELGNATDQIDITVFRNMMILITDRRTTYEQIQALKRDASRQDVLLLEIADRSSEPEYVVTEKLAQALADNLEDVKHSDVIIDWTTGSLGLNVLSRFAQDSDITKAASFNHKLIVSAIDGSFPATSRIAQSTFDVLMPESILLIKPESLDGVFAAKEPQKIVDNIAETGATYRLIGVQSRRFVEKITPLNFMTYTINYMVNRGVSINNILLILSLPLIATIIAFARQVIGLKAFGIFTPSILALAFLATGIKYGLIIFAVIIIIGSLGRWGLKKSSRLSYLPRLALVVTIISFAILAMLALGAVFDQRGLIAITIFPVLIMATVIEDFATTQIARSGRTAIWLTIETVILAIAAYYIVSWEALRTLILAYPELVLLTIAADVALGYWTGLRLKEYFRFKEVRRFKEEDFS